MTLKLRLAIWYGALFAVVLAAALFAAYREHADAHIADDDAMLGATWRNAARAAAAALTGAGVSDALLHEAQDTWGPDVDLFMLDARGAVVARADRERLAGLDQAVAGAPDGSSTAVVGGAHLRLVAGPVGADGHRLVAATSLASLDESLSRLGRFLAVLGVVGVVVAVSGGLVISGSALRPIALVTQTASAIAGSQHFSARVTTPARDDEVGRLARTFNAMLDSLEDAYARQQRFVGDASHELRTPLAAIRTHVALLAAARDGEREELLGRVQREVERLCDLVGDLLILSRADAGSEPFAGTPVQLDEVLMDVFEGLHAHEPARLSIAMLDAAPVIGERDRLVQLVLILVDNALRYTPPEGHVRVSLSTTAQGVELRVEDDGVGIDPADASRLFDRFYRGESARRMDPTGSGLGLAIALWIVERHGGSISIVPRDPRGTLAVVRLPLAAPALG